MRSWIRRPNIKRANTKRRDQLEEQQQKQRQLLPQQEARKEKQPLKMTHLLIYQEKIFQRS
jgi:hypothetical protein